MRLKIERICRTDSMSSIPMEGKRFDLQASKRSLMEMGYGIEDHELYMVLTKGDLDITVYLNGRMLIHPMDDKKGARELALSIYSHLIEE